MMPVPFRVQRIDHIKVCVPDRYAAARWYEQVLGLQILRGPAWEMAAGLPDGPLYLGTTQSTDSTKVCLFEGEAQGDHPPIGQTRTCFSVDGAAFLQFRDRLAALGLANEEGQPVTAGDVVDNMLAWSLYFNDPYGNRYELVTYDYTTVEQQARPPPPAPPL